MTRDEPAVVVEGLSFRYAGATGQSLTQVDLTIAKGSLTLLVGPTGAGKSTLYLTLNGLIPQMIKGQFKGRVRVAGMDTAEYSIPDLAQKVGIVFQDPEVQLFSLSVGDELAFGPENLGVAPGEIETRLKAAATIIGLDEIIDSEPARLSGGQQQKVAIGAMWTMLPDILILDEPTSNLDPVSSLRVLDLIVSLNRDYGKTILLAEHKIDAVAALADHVLVMRQGQIVASGAPRDVFSRVDELLALGIAPPQVTMVADALGKAGMPLPSVPLTVDEFVAGVASVSSGADAHR